MRRVFHARRRLGPVNQAVETTSGNSRSETTTSTSREEQLPYRSSLIKTDTVPLVCLQTRSDEAKPSDSKICSRCDQEVEWRKAISKWTVLYRGSGLVYVATGINFSATTALRFAEFEGLPLNNLRALQDV